VGYKTRALEIDVFPQKRLNCDVLKNRTCSNKGKKKAKIELKAQQQGVSKKWGHSARNVTFTTQTGQAIKD